MFELVRMVMDQQWLNRFLVCNIGGRAGSSFDLGLFRIYIIYYLIEVCANG
jgi:hypothetical protein